MTLQLKAYTSTAVNSKVMKNYKLWGQCVSQKKILCVTSYFSKNCIMKDKKVYERISMTSKAIKQ